MAVTESEPVDCLSRALLTAQQRNCSLFPGRGKRIFCSRKPPDRFWCRAQPSVKSVPGVCCGIRSAGARSYHPFCARAKNVRRYGSIRLARLGTGPTHLHIDEKFAVETWQSASVNLCRVGMKLQCIVWLSVCLSGRNGRRWWTAVGVSVRQVAVLNQKDRHKHLDRVSKNVSRQVRSTEINK